MMQSYDMMILKKVITTRQLLIALLIGLILTSCHKRIDYVLKNYDYQKKQLVKVRESRIPLEEFYERCNEHEEMNLQPYMFDMWERFATDFYSLGSGLKDAEIFIQ